MKRLSLIEITKVLRKDQKSHLWNIHLKNWTPANWKDFYCLSYGLTRKIRRAERVRRISDGKTYRSMRQCGLDNGIGKTAIKNKIELGIEFIKV